MKKLLMAMAFVSLFSGSAVALDVYNDSGGMVAKYDGKFAGHNVRVFGRCASACTLALRDRGTCAGPNASFVFHASTSPRMTRWLMNQYPPTVRAWINRKGGLTSRLITLEGAELHRIVRSCFLKKS